MIPHTQVSALSGSAAWSAQRQAISVRPPLAAAPVPTATNLLLDLLPATILDTWRCHLETVELPLGKELYGPGETQEFVYFPTTAIVTLLVTFEDGASSEIAVAGHEGLVGITLFLGGNSTPSRAVVQSAGHALKLKLSVLMEEFHKGGPVMHLLLRYTQALITQMSQTAVCNRHHSLQQQLCRWLLMTLDRLEGDRIVMTQELIATMLGVRREGVTDAANLLRSDRIIDYRRGRIFVLDRPRLEARCCECYGVVKREYDRLLPYAHAE
jgi:CRP-like cAMP-binding protein